MKKLKGSIDHFTGREREALNGVRKQLVKQLQPLLVLYLGSLATTTLRRNMSVVERHPATDFRLSCELVVILPEGATLLNNLSALRALERSLSAHASVRLLALTREGLVHQLASGSHPRINLHSEAIVLYERDGVLGKVVQEVASAVPRVCVGVPPRNDGPFGSAQGDMRVDGVRGDAAPAASCNDGFILPVGLSAEERADPLSVVVSCFRMYPLPEAQERIESWLKAVVSAPDWPVAETGRHLDFYIAVCRLVSCAALLRGYATPLWVLHMLEAKDGGASMPPQSLYCPNEGADAWNYFPGHLSRAEFGAPGVVFKGLFADKSPGVWLSELYELFSLSLTDCTPAALGEDRDLAGVTMQLHRLMEACHLLAVWARKAGGKSLAAGDPPVAAPPKAQQAPVTSVL